MGKQELVKNLATAAGVTSSQVERILGELSVIVGREVNAKNEIVVPGLGKFEIKERAEREGRNPLTGKTQVFLAKNSVVFKPAKELRDKIVQPAPAQA